MSYPWTYNTYAYILACVVGLRNKLVKSENVSLDDIVMNELVTMKVDIQCLHSHIINISSELMELRGIMLLSNKTARNARWYESPSYP